MSDDPIEDGGLEDAQLEDLTERVREGLEHGVLGPDSGIGIYPRELELEADGLTITATLGDEVLLEHDFEPEAWEDVKPDDPAVDVVGMAEVLALELYDRVDVGERLVERRRDRLVDLVVDEVETELPSRLEAAAPGIDWDVSVDVVELPPEYRHGDPEWVYERGYPPFGLEIWSWDPDVEVVVDIEDEPPDVDRLVAEAVERLLEAVDDG